MDWLISAKLCTNIHKQCDGKVFTERCEKYVLLIAKYLFVSLKKDQCGSTLAL